MPLILSETLREPVILRTTTRINHSNAVVTLGALRAPQTRGRFEKDPFHFVTVPAVSRQLHARLLETMARAQALAEESPYNFEEGSGPWGVICNGVSYTYVADAIQDLQLEDQVRVLRIGFSHPLPAERIGTFSSGLRKSVGGGGRRALHGRGGQGFRPGKGAFFADQRQGADPFFAPLRVRPGDGTPETGRLFWHCLPAAGGPGFVGCAGNSPATAHALCGVLPPGDVLCR
jgi:hypothetical protein